MNGHRTATAPQAATEEEQALFFEQLHQGFQTASARTGETVRDFRVAGTSVRLRFAGDALIPTITPGLAHPVAQIDSQPHCEVCLWDSESSGVRVPASPRPWVDFTGRGNIWGFDSSRYRSAYLWGESSINIMDREKALAVFWVRSAQHLPPWVLAAPLRSILHWWMEMNNRQLVHAAAVGYGGRGVLLPGRGGSGKSSTSLTCLQNGFDFVSDDYLALALDPKPRAYRLYSTAKIAPESLGLYPELTSRCRVVHQPGFDKVVLFLEDGFSEQLKESLPLQLVVKPRVSGQRDTTLGPAPPLEIERELASETLIHLPHAGSQTVEFLDRIAHELPCASVELGTDRAQIAIAIQNALAAPLARPLRRHRVRKQQAFVSVIVHFREEQRQELRDLALAVERQGYTRTELLVLASGPARAMMDEGERLAGHVRMLDSEQPSVNGQAWNRAIRESFAELLILIEPSDRFAPGGITALVRASEMDSRAAWFHGRVVSGVENGRLLGPLRGALIRKSAFRECGLFPMNFHLQGREHIDWLARAQETGLVGKQIEATTLFPAGDIDAAPPLLAPDLGLLRAQIAQGRKKVE
jgi:hypothetical protein